MMRLSIALSLVGFLSSLTCTVLGQASRPTEHEHLMEVACIDLPADQVGLDQYGEHHAAESDQRIQFNKTSA